MVHSGEKSNQCNQCHYVCCDPSALRRHLKTHIREKTSKCNQCQFASHQVGNLRRHLLNGGEKKDEHCYIFLWSTTCRVVVLTCSVLKIAKSKQKSESFSLNISLWDISAFPFLAGILASSNFFGSSKVSMLSEIFGKNIRKKFPANTNTNIIRFEKITRIRIRIIFGLKNYPNTNTNNIRFEKITRIRIRIIFGFKKSPEYEYEYKYSASSILIIFEYRIIRSPLGTMRTTRL